MSEEELKFVDDKLFVYTPLPQYGEGICKEQLVMTKEIFQECYKKWIEPQERKEQGMKKAIVLRDKFSDKPIVIRTSAIKAVRSAFDNITEDMYSEVMIESLFISVKETIATVMVKIKEAESEE